MKNMRNAIVSFITAIVLAAVACAQDSNMTVFTVLMIASIVAGAAFVVFANLATREEKKSAGEVQEHAFGRAA